MALFGMPAATFEVVRDTLNPPTVVYGGFLLRPDGAVVPIPKPSRGSLFLRPKAIADGRGRAHVLWGTASDTVSRERSTPDTIWYARFEGGTWTRPEMVFAKRGQSLYWNGTAEAAALVADSQIIATIPTHDSLYVVHRSTGKWTHYAFPLGSFYTTLSTGAGRAALLAFAPAYFPRGRWDTKGVYVTRSVTDGRHWAEPQVVHRATDTGKGVPGNLHLLAAQGTVYLVWAYGEQAMVPDTVFLMSSVDDGISWQRAPGLHVAGGLHGLRAAIGPDSSVQIVGTGSFGGGDLLRAAWKDGQWTAVQSFPHALGGTAPAAVSGEPSLGKVSPDSLYLTWMVMRPLRRERLAPIGPGAPTTWLSIYTACAGRDFP